MPYDVNVRVRYAETDQMGVVYHSNYIVYFEIGRTEAMRQIGITYAELEKRGFVLAVTETGCRYKGSARYDDELVIRTWLRDVSKTRLRFEYEVRRDDATLATGFTTLAFLARNNDMRPVRCPDDVEKLARQAIEPSGDQP